MAKSFVAKVSRGTFKNSDGEEKTNFVEIGRAVAHANGTGLDFYPNFAPMVVNGSFEKISLFPIEPKQQPMGGDTAKAGGHTHVHFINTISWKHIRENSKPS